MKALINYTSHRPSVKRLAEAVGVTSGFICQIKSGEKQCPEKLAVAIERATGGAVTRKDLRPDWRELWPELEGE